jgi:hypothetical protein
MGRPSYLTSSFCVKRSGDDDCGEVWWRDRCCDATEERLGTNGRRRSGWIWSLQSEGAGCCRQVDAWGPAAGRATRHIIGWSNT